jgi:hypothetical protein
MDAVSLAPICFSCEMREISYARQAQKAFYPRARADYSVPFPTQMRLIRLTGREGILQIA